MRHRSLPACKLVSVVWLAPVRVRSARVCPDPHGSRHGRHTSDREDACDVLVLFGLVSACFSCHSCHSCAARHRTTVRSTVNIPQWAQFFRGIHAAAHRTLTLLVCVRFDQFFMPFFIFVVLYVFAYVRELRGGAHSGCGRGRHSSARAPERIRSRYLRSRHQSVLCDSCPD